MKFIDIINENWASLKKLINVKKPLFHATNSIVNILRDGYIKSSLDSISSFGGKQSGISMSRNLEVLTKDWRFGSVVLVLDENMLKQKYKTLPLDYWKDKTPESFEFEERILTEKIPIKKYLKGIVIDGYGKNKAYLNDWVSWKNKFNLSFDVIVKNGNKYMYAKDMI